MTERLSILVAESTGFPAEARDVLGRLGTPTYADLDRSGLLAHIGGADLLWVRLRHFIGEEVFDAAPKLRWVATPTTGLTHIDTDLARRRGIEVVCLRGEKAFLENVRATAELTLALMLMLLRHLPDALRHVQEGGWDRDLFRGGELYEKTVGIVGYGRLGRLVGRYLQAFGSVVVATDTREVEPECGVVLAPLRDVLAEAEIVTLHASLEESNRAFFGSDCFLAMKPGSLFINSARGELVDEGALLRALESGHLRGAAVDVLADEQSPTRPDNPLLHYAKRNRNLLVTPHLGGCTRESMAKAEIYLASLLAVKISASFEGPAPGSSSEFDPAKSH